MTAIAYVVVLGAALIAYGFSAVFVLAITIILAAIEIRSGLIRRIPLPRMMA